MIEILLTKAILSQTKTTQDTGQSFWSILVNFKYFSQFFHPWKKRHVDCSIFGHGELLHFPVHLMLNFHRTVSRCVSFAIALYVDFPIFLHGDLAKHASQDVISVSFAQSLERRLQQLDFGIYFSVSVSRLDKVSQRHHLNATENISQSISFSQDMYMYILLVPFLHL